ncbi:MAG: carboxypeptidase regulatory-like domain-containing protein, partial [Actinobacteria bacterium]
MRLTRRAGGLLLALALVLGLAAAAQAQTGAASITGLVTDQSGAAAPGVTVTATNQATNVSYTAVSNTAGNYTITSVPIGTYVVKSELTGFKISATKPIVLEAKQIARLDFKMEVGGIEDTVEVTAESPVLQTETATVGEVISARTVESLPLNGRNANQLALLLPGAITPNPDTFTTARNSGGGCRPYINGNSEQTNNFLLDGIDMNETVDNRIAYQPSPDALAEISVETNNYAADVGNV